MAAALTAATPAGTATARDGTTAFLGTVQGAPRSDGHSLISSAGAHSGAIRVFDPVTRRTRTIGLGPDCELVGVGGGTVSAQCPPVPGASQGTSFVLDVRTGLRTPLPVLGYDVGSHWVTYGLPANEDGHGGGMAVLDYRTGRSVSLPYGDDGPIDLDSPTFHRVLYRSVEGTTPEEIVGTADRSLSLRALDGAAIRYDVAYASRAMPRAHRLARCRHEDCGDVVLLPRRAAWIDGPTIVSTDLHGGAPRRWRAPRRFSGLLRVGGRLVAVARASARSRTYRVLDLRR